MRKLTFLCTGLLLATLGTIPSWAQTYYHPTTRAKSIEIGKKYFIYDAAINNQQYRTGFLYDNGSTENMGHSGTSVKPSTFITTETKYLWTLETVEGQDNTY